MKDILKFIRRVKYRMGWNTWLVWLFRSLIVASVIDVILSAIAIFVPWYEVVYFMIGILGVGMLCGIILTLFFYPSNKTAALTADGFGAKEALITAYELQEKNDTFSVLQRKQAVDWIQSTSAKSLVKIALPWKNAGVFAGLCFISFMILFIPSPAKEKAVILREAKEAFKEKENVLEKLEEQIDEHPQLTDEEKQMFEQFLQEALMQYENAFMDEDVSMEKTLERMHMQLEKLMDSEMSAAMEEMAMEMAKTLELTPENLAQFAEGNLSELKELSELSNDAGATINSAGQNGGSNNNSEAQSGENGSGEGDGNGENGEGSGNGNGNGGNGGSGNGNGEGQGSGTGVGWDTGSKEGFETNPLRSEPESIYIPEYGQGDDENLTGEKTDAGSGYRAPSDQVLAWSGQSVDYEQAVGEYSAGAMSQIERLSIPESMKDMIKSYFDGLNN